MKTASDDALLAVPGVTKKHVAAIRAAFGALSAPSQVSSKSEFEQGDQEIGS